MFSCIQELFKEEDYKKNIMNKDHNFNESPWIFIDKDIYSIKNDDVELLHIFKDYYGKDIKEFLIQHFSNQKRIEIIDKLKKRKIGSLQ